MIKLPKKSKSRKKTALYTIAIILFAIGSLLMILIGLSSILAAIGFPGLFVLNFGVAYFLSSSFGDLGILAGAVWGIITAALGVASLIVTYKGYNSTLDEILMLVLLCVFCVLGGSVGGVLIFVGLILYVVDMII